MQQSLFLMYYLKLMYKMFESKNDAPAMQFEY